MNTQAVSCVPAPRAFRLNKNTLFVALSVGGAIFVLALSQSGAKKQQSPSSGLATQQSPRAYALDSLADDYSKLPVPRATIAPAQIIEIPAKAIKVDTSNEKRLREAQQSDLTFDSVSLPGGLLKDLPKLPITNNPVVDSALGETNQQNSRDEANRQDEKLQFLNANRAADPYLRQSVIKPISDTQLMAGTIIPGILITGLNSDLPGQIIGQVSQNVFDTVTGKIRLLPQGTKVLGQYDSRISYGQERLLIVWTRLIFPNGQSISLEGMPGTDLSGYAGLSDQVDNHYVKLLGGVLLGSFLSAGLEVTQSRRQFEPTYGQLALEGAAKNTNDAGQQITKRMLNIQPTIVIRPGSRFNIFVTKDMVLPRYEETLDED